MFKFTANAAAAFLAELADVDRAIVRHPELQGFLLRCRTVLYLRAAAIRAAAEGTIIQG